MNNLKSKSTVPIVSIFMLLFFLVGCSGGGGGGDDPLDDSSTKEAEVKIGAFQIGVTTVFRVTVKSVSGISDANSFNLIGEDTEIGAKGFNEQVENYVVNQTTIPLKIYDSGGSEVASVTLNGNDYIDGEFEGTVSLGLSTNSINAFVIDSSYTASDYTVYTQPNDLMGKSLTGRAQIDNLDILASGIIDDLTISNTTKQIQVPLNCGSSTPGSVRPNPGDGFFIINDVMIEFNYAFDNPEAFNDTFTVKFIESNRNFDNMKLLFRLPGRTQIVNARTGQVLTAGEAATVFDDINTAVSASNPFKTGIAM